MPKTEAAVKAAAEKMALLRSRASLSFKAAAVAVEPFVARLRDTGDGAKASTEERSNGRSKEENLMVEDKGFEDCVRCELIVCVPNKINNANRLTDSLVASCTVTYAYRTVG